MGSKGQMFQSYANIIEYIWRENKDSNQEFESKINSLIIKFMEKLSQFGERFSQSTQEDAHEFLLYLLDIFHEDLNRVSSKKFIKEKEYQIKLESLESVPLNYLSVLENQAIDQWEQYLLRDKSVIVDLFQGQFLSTLTCLDCYATSHKFESFVHLSVDVTKDKLIDCIQDFIQSEELQLKEQWLCYSCQKKTRSTKKIDIWKCPNLLIIQLKRFKYTEQFSSKLKNVIEFPIQNLNLSKLVKGPQKNIPTYQLIAVAQHQGNLTSGHYTALARNRYDQNWYLYDDQNVYIVQDQNDIVNEKAYILFYQKNSVDNFRRQTIQNKQSWPHLQS